MTKRRLLTLLRALARWDSEVLERASEEELVALVSFSRALRAAVDAAEEEARAAGQLVLW